MRHEATEQNSSICLIVKLIKNHRALLMNHCFLFDTEAVICMTFSKNQLEIV